jgi:hypothetical protein
MLICDLGKQSRFLLAQDIAAEAIVGTLARGPGQYWARYGTAQNATALTVTAEQGRSAVWFGWGGTAPPRAALDRVFDALRNAG